MEQRYEIGNKTYLRVVEPSAHEVVVRLQRRGFVWADRTIKVAIPLAKVTMDLKRFQRLPIIETSEYREDIFRIAHESFTQDRRFHVAPNCDPKISAVVLRQRVDNLGVSFVCLYHDKPIGFLNLKENEVHLAAVEEKYRMTGAAMGLYAHAIEVAKERGFKSLEGRISSLNVAVMNLYASFGAIFSEPQDVFLKVEELEEVEKVEV